mgnify:CR=1 FL=1
MREHDESGRPKVFSQATMLRIRLRRTILLSAPAVQRRSLWQCATLSSPSPTALLENVQETVAEDAAAAVTVFALSKNVPQQLVSAFRRALAPSGSNTTAIGCLSEILPAAASSTSPLLKDQELFSIALLDTVPPATLSGPSRSAPPWSVGPTSLSVAKSSRSSKRTMTRWTRGSRRF